MSLAPTRQFRPPYLNDSMRGSLVKLHGASQLRFLRYGSSSSLDKHASCSVRKIISSESRVRRLRPKGSNFVPSEEGGNWRSNGESSSSRSSCSASSSSSSWLDMWSKNRLPNSPKPPGRVVNYRNAGAVRVSNVSNWGSKRSGSSSGSESVSVGGGSSTMDKIVEKLKKFGYMEDERDTGVKFERRIEKGSVEDIFYVEDGVLPNTRGGFSDDSPLGVKRYAGGDGEARFPWEKPVELPEEVKNSVRKKSRTSVAELTIPEPELRRLKNLSMKTKQKVKVGGAGVTHAVVDAIHEKWKDSEVVRVKVEGSSALNMRRIHVILERKTGGLVIWRSGTSVALYRGISYNVPSENMKKRTFEKNGYDPNLPSTYPNESIRVSQKPNSHDGVYPLQERPQGNKDEIVDSEFSNEVTYEDEIEKLLADLGPRYEDWPGGDPLPVDADMLPSVVPGYQPPFRLLPYGVRASISVKEATALRRIARTLPPHFALGRNRQLQGLATAMVKLWEKSSIAKVSLKRGVQVTTSERMAEDIKRLTGGTLLSRNKDFLVFYRGKNFLSPDVSEALLERERLAMRLQDEEELARLRSSAMVVSTAETAEQPIAAGTLGETLNADAQWGKKLDDRDKENALREAEKLKHAKIVKRLERKLVMAEKKLMKGEQALAKVEGLLNPSDREADPNSITDEERFMFRKLGLKMKAFLLLGRRGVFDGTIENMHLHWKYRELVKIIVKVKSFEEVKMIALSLEAESGGVLVSVDKVSKGYAVVVFRGKGYQRPSMLRPQNLLTKRKALARSVELQRREALLKHIATMQRNVGKLRSEIDEVETMKGEGDTAFYDKIDSAYPSEEEDSEEEGDDSYLMTFNSDSDDEGDGGSKFAKILNSETNSDPYHEQFMTDQEQEHGSSYVGDDSESNGDDEQQQSSPELPWDIEEEAETGPNP